MAACGQWEDPVPAVIRQVVRASNPLVPSVYSLQEGCFATQRNLELYKTITDHARAGSLLGLLDKTVTSMGGRMLQRWMRHPLVDIHDIQERLDAVQELKDDLILRGLPLGANNGRSAID